MAISLGEGMYPEMELPGGYFMGELDPFQQDFGEDDDIDDQNGWMVVNEGDFTQLLNQIEEAEQREDEEEVRREEDSFQKVAEAYENSATEKLEVKAMDERGDTEETEHVPTTVTLTPSKSTDFWTTDLVAKEINENEAVNKPTYTEAATESLITTGPTSVIPSATSAAVGKGTTASLNHAETTLSSVDDLDLMTSEYQ
ncbi:unnamed protein product [Taenia asiatica]|uniref:GYF domain-containing protein n=1 Tax=Taenia asiatica TaxID=60517 RepID=A0A0R3VTF9_TAEAS|nr:unnamed protein product [Taenia asiatica]